MSVSQFPGARKYRHQHTSPQQNADKAALGKYIQEDIVRKDARIYSKGPHGKTTGAISPDRGSQKLLYSFPVQLQARENVIVLQHEADAEFGSTQQCNPQ